MPEDKRVKNEGEGSRTAARRYNRATEAYVKKHDVERAAEAAKKALEGPEREELERAESEGMAAPESKE